MARLRLFGPAREAAGRGVDVVAGGTVGSVLAEAARRFGPGFADVLSHSAVWLNGEDADDGTAVSDDDELAVLPPVSGGC